MPLIPECQFKEILNRSLNNIDIGNLTYNITEYNMYNRFCLYRACQFIHSNIPRLFFLTWHV